MKKGVILAILVLAAVISVIMYNKFGVTLALPHDKPAEIVKDPTEIGEEATVLDAVESFLTMSQLQEGTGEGAATEVVPLSSEDDIIPSVDYIKVTPGGHFFTKDIEVGITFEMDGVDSYKIYYTNDGTEPTKESKEFTKPINYMTFPSKLNVQCLKIKVFYVADGEEMETGVLTHTYFVGENVDTRFDTLVFSITTDPYNLFDYEYGIFVTGKLRADFIKQNPRKDIVPPDPANYNIRGIEGERPVYVEAFEADGTRVVAQGAGVRVHGNWSRDHLQKSMKLIAKRIYEPFKDLGKFHYNFFDGAHSVSNYPNTVAFDEYDAVVLRNGANDFNGGFMRDEISASLARKAGFPDASYFRPVSIYLNGDYYGFSWMHEAFDVDYLQQNYQAPDANFAILEFYESDRGNFGCNIDDGPDYADDDFMRFYMYKDKDLTDDAVYAELCELVDIDNLTMYYAMQCYIDNRDWPRGNMKVWRYYGTNDGSSEYLDGKWRFLFYDNEFAWGLYDNKHDNNTLKRLIGVGDTYNGGMSNILKALMKRPDYAEKFVNTLCDLANDSFSNKSVLETMEYLAAIQDNELSTAIKNLSNYSGGGIDGNRTTIKRFAEWRPVALYRHMKDYFALKGTYFVNFTGAEGVSVKLNSIPVNGADEKRIEYFIEYGVPLSVEAVEPGYEFLYWLVNGEKVSGEKANGDEIRLTADMCIDGEMTVEAVTEKKEISPIIIREVYPSGNADWIKVYNNSSKPASVGGLRLTDDLNEPGKWVFPELTVDAYSDLLLICNNNKQTEALMNVAVTFSVKEGEILYLSDAEGNMLTRIKIPRMNKQEVLSYNFRDGLFHVVPVS